MNIIWEIQADIPVWCRHCYFADDDVVSKIAMPACLLSKYRNRQFELLPGPQYNQARPPSEQEDAEEGEEEQEDAEEGEEEQEDAEEGPPEEEGGGPEAAEGFPPDEVRYAQLWWQQRGSNRPTIIPKEYYPCKFHFAGREPCKNGRNCGWSHSKIYRRQEFLELIKVHREWELEEKREKGKGKGKS